MFLSIPENNCKDMSFFAAYMAGTGLWYGYVADNQMWFWESSEWP